MRRFATSTALLLMLTSCATTSETSGTTTTAPPAPQATATTATTSTLADTPPDSPCLVGDRPFSSSGVISAFGGATGDAAQISSLRSGSHPGCERVVVDLLTADGAPAGSLGLVGVEYDEEVGIVRINLPAMILRTAVADSLFDGELAEHAYVVRTTEGHLAVDIHVVAGAAVALRAFEVDAPSRIVVDLRPNPDATPVRGAIAAGGIIVVTPGPGRTTAPLTVSGYVRPHEANVVASLHEEQGSEPLAETTTTAPERAGAWGEFEVRFATLPQQRVELFVGSTPRRGGSPNGAWITLGAAATTPDDL